MKALLIIDMQKISFNPLDIRYDAKAVIDRINRLAAKFRETGNLVVLIQHDGTAEDYCIPGTNDWELLDELQLDSSDLLTSKTANDAFYNSTLKSELEKRNIHELIITGCATDFCVDSTIKSALVNDFKVTVIADAHTTANREGINAKQVIDHYNWVWSEMSATKYKMKVQPCNDYLAKL